MSSPVLGTLFYFILTRTRRGRFYYLYYCIFLFYKWETEDYVICPKEHSWWVEKAEFDSRSVGLQHFEVNHCLYHWYHMQGQIAKPSGHFFGSELHNFLSFLPLFIPSIFPFSLK